LTLQNGWIICDGYDPVVDEYRDVIQNAKKWLTEYTQKLIESTQISNIRIKYTSASGYFIEISKAQTSKVPEYFLHKQTLVNASRYITVELQEFQEKLLTAEQHMSEREYKIFLEIREEILTSFSYIKSLSEQVAHIDYIASSASVAYHNNFCLPELRDDFSMHIIEWRHPVIEWLNGDFISNDLDISADNFVQVLTGPNMGWKSTFLRQNALIILMAHMGIFVPATSAKIGITDKIFSRVWANDNLFLGQSTFMVEMQEVGNIMNHSTERSFVIIDEVWRGTSTYDGMSLAWAILKYNHDQVGAKTLFATHYHELVDEAESLSSAKNFSVSVWERNGEIVFYRKIIPGSIKKSYGLAVAKLAGIHWDILDEAGQMLQKLESLHHTSAQVPQLSLWDITDEIWSNDHMDQVKKILKNTDIDHITPRQAMDILDELKHII